MDQQDISVIILCVIHVSYLLSLTCHVSGSKRCCIVCSSPITLMSPISKCVELSMMRYIYGRFPSKIGRVRLYFHLRLFMNLCSHCLRPTWFPSEIGLIQSHFHLRIFVNPSSHHHLLYSDLFFSNPSTLVPSLRASGTAPKKSDVPYPFSE